MIILILLESLLQEACIYLSTLAVIAIFSEGNLLFNDAWTLWLEFAFDWCLCSLKFHCLNDQTINAWFTAVRGVYPLWLLSLLSKGNIPLKDAAKLCRSLKPFLLGLHLLWWYEFLLDWYIMSDGSNLNCFVYLFSY